MLDSPLAHNGLGHAAAKPSPPAISRAELSRIEGLGDNCELGFVLRRMGFDDGMLLRWASIKPDSLLATLRADFAQLYEFDNLVPENPKMVRDLRYGTAWHSEMRSRRIEGEKVFVETVEDRRPIHAKEVAKLAYLVAKLRRKLEHPNPLFVIKSNAGIPEDILEGIHYQLYRRASSAQFVFLDVQADPARAGSVEVLGRNRLRGFVSQFASYANADEGDDASWHSVLTQALAYKASDAVAGHVIAGEGLAQPVILPFPSVRHPQLTTAVHGDLRAGMPHMLRGNAWCRPLDDMYRLHATGTAEKAAVMLWTGVHVAPKSVICFTAGCAVAESKPVEATLRVRDGSGRGARATKVFDTVGEQDFNLGIPPGFSNPLEISLTVEPVSPLGEGALAVIDLQPPQIRPG